VAESAESAEQPLNVLSPNAMLGLQIATDPAWAAQAVLDLDAVLIDHAHCEMKAAANALSLVARHPDDLGLVRALTDVAREEIEHFQRVIEFLARRGLKLGHPPVDTYAADLRRAAASHPAGHLVPPVVDRLLVCALIEARSCERFKLLAGAGIADPEMHAFYMDLFAAEAKHYRTFVDLAISAASGDSALVEARLVALSTLEGAIVQQLAGRERRGAIHG
jgi:tRNA-(ms[2]io[6]A)-hydroxylase